MFYNWYNNKIMKVSTLTKINKIIGCVILSLILLSSALLMKPSQAYAYTTAKAYTWKTNINADIITDGTMNISESKIIDITKFIEKAKKSATAKEQDNTKAIKLSPLVWNLYDFPEESDVVLGDAKIAILGNDDNVIGNWSTINIGEFLAKWHTEDSPDSSIFAYDSRDKQMCLYTELVNQDKLSEKKCAEILTNMTGNNNQESWNFTKAIINIDYAILRAENIYKDVADYKWPYCQDSWYMDSYNVDVKINIPVGNQSIASPLGKVTNLENNPERTTERNIYAWGHGSSNGIVDLQPNGTIFVHNDIVPAGSNAELRVVFPSAWLNNLDPQTNISQQNQSKLTTILKEESVWRDFRTDAVNKLLLPIGFCSFCIFILIITLFLNRLTKKKFNVNTISKKKLLDLHPSVLVRLKNWNHEYAHDLIASILKLNELKKICVSRLSSGDYCISTKGLHNRKDAYTIDELNITDKRTINFLFSQIACGNKNLLLSDILNYAHARPYDFMTGYLTWQSLLTDEVNKLVKFKSNFDRIRHVMFGTASISLILSLILGIVFADIFTPIIGIFTAFIIALLGNSTRNNISFKDSQGNTLSATNLEIGLGEYTELTDKFRIKATKTLKQAILDAQDLITIGFK